MSLNEKYTQEELDAIPPFTGFHHNKTIDKISKAIKLGLDKLPDTIKYSKIIPEAYEGIKKSNQNIASADPSSFLFDELAHFNRYCYDAPPKPLTHDDEVSPFGKVNLWDFPTKPSIKFDYPEINKDVAEAWSTVVEKFKEEKENLPRDVIKNIVDKIHERKLCGKECEVAIMSYSDYDAIQSMHDFETHSIWISGSLLRIHSSINLKDGEIEIY